MKTMKKEDAVAAGLYKVIGKEIDDRYMEELKKQSIHPNSTIVIVRHMITFQEDYSPRKSLIWLTSTSASSP